MKSNKIKRNRLEIVLMQPVDDVFDDGVRGAGGGAEAKGLNVLKIFGFKLLGVFNESRMTCGDARQFRQITAVGAVL